MLTATLSYGGGHARSQARDICSQSQSKPILYELLSDSQLSQRVACRARILLCRAGDQRVIQVGSKVDPNSSTGGGTAQSGEGLRVLSEFVS